MRITGIQFDIKWEDKQENLRRLDSLISKISHDTDILVLPEMFTTGFSMNPLPFSENMDGPTVNWMREKAEQLSAVVCGSIMIQDGKSYRNRFLWIENTKKEIQYYDKVHPFCLINEGEYFEAGKQRKIIEYKDWRIFPSICYDLRFPVWNRNDMDYDILLNVANWPAVRAHSWKHFLIARAMENQAYVVGVNRVGNDITSMHFSGDSCILSYDGKILSNSKEGEIGIVYAELLKSQLDSYRKKYPFLEDMDQFSLE